MKMVASSLGRDEDIKVYDADIEYSTRALNELAWDEESGYFGYTEYDENGNVKGIMRTDDGENFNKGMDGIYPLVAGAVRGKRKERLIEHIKNPNEMWSRAGISAVDMSASYYFDDGYWNGNVWMSHQWFVWKTMLDNGDTDFAFEIANRALEMWKEETDFTYFTYECFGIKTRRGGWFHNFGGLSTPISIWTNAYFKAGTLTAGLDTMVNYKIFNENNTAFNCKITHFGDSEKFSVIAVMNDCKKDYSVTVNGKKSEFNLRENSAVEIVLESGDKEYEISIS